TGLDYRRGEYAIAENVRQPGLFFNRSRHLVAISRMPVSRAGEFVERNFGVNVSAEIGAAKLRNAIGGVAADRTATRRQNRIITVKVDHWRVGVHRVAGRQDKRGHLISSVCSGPVATSGPSEL